MRTSKVFRGVAVGVCVVAGVLVAVAGASAAPRLAITYEGIPYAGKNLTTIEFRPSSFTWGCGQSYQGQNNTDRSTVTDTLEGQAPEEESGCTPGYSITLGFTALKLSWNEQLRTLGDQTRISAPGPCIYKFQDLAGTVAEPFPYVAVYSGSATGFLLSRGSLLSCSPLETVGFRAFVQYPVLEENGILYPELGTELFG